MKLKIKSFILCLSLLSFIGNAQDIDMRVPIAGGAHIFQYDEAGNQIFRGYVCIKCPATDKIEEPIKSIKSTVLQNDSSEDKFWNEVQIYPVPVKNVLTIVWSDKVDSLIDEVSLYEQNTVHWKFQQKNMPNLNRQVQIDMTRYYMGVYILTFQLRDGKIISKNITKF